MKAIDVAGFERKFRENIDPWDYTNSDLNISNETSSCAPAGMAYVGVRWSWDAQLARQRDLFCALCLSWGARWLADSPSRGEKAGTRRSCEICPGKTSCECPAVLRPYRRFWIAYYLSVHELALLGKNCCRYWPRGKIVLLHHRRHFQMLRNCPVSRTFDCDLS